MLAYAKPLIFRLRAVALRLGSVLSRALRPAGPGVSVNQPLIGGPAWPALPTALWLLMEMLAPAGRTVPSLTGLSPGLAQTHINNS